MYIMNISDFLLLEKKDEVIKQISYKFPFTFLYDVCKEKIYKRSSGEKISNADLSLVVNDSIDDISKKIYDGEIVNGQKFFISSNKKMLAMSVVADFQEGSYWKLNIEEVWEETEDNRFSVESGQVLIRN